MALFAKRLGAIIGLTVGSCFSPTWVLLPVVLQPYFDIHRAMTGLPGFVAEMTQYHSIVQAYPNLVLSELIPNLMLVLLLGLGYIYIVSWLGGCIGMLVYKHVLDPASN